jgi:NADH-quinone oxidoreductase subunit N
MTATDLFGILPLALPAVGGLWVLLLVAIAGDRDLRWPAVHSLIVLAFSAIPAIVLLGHGARQVVFDGALVIDPMGLCFHLLFLLVAALTILVSVEHLAWAGAAHGEFYAMILFAVTGMSLMAASENLLTLFVGLETLSVSLYVLAGFARDRVLAVEGAIKYFLLGAFSTGFILYGMALLYGVTGSIDLRGIRDGLATFAGQPIDPLALAGAALLLIGLGFKAAAVPFHFWAPDVYQGSMAPVAGFMAAGTKAAAFAMLLRVVNVALGGAELRDRWTAILSAIAILTMVLGNVVALAQVNIKRMLAYSSIANAGYLLVAVVAGATAGGAAAAGGPGGDHNGAAPVVLFYLAAYAFMTIGAFAVAALVGRSGEDDSGFAIVSYAGLARRRPAIAAAMAIFMFSLTGIPPTGGFMGKFYVFKSAVDSGLYGLAVVGVLASVVGSFYYVRVVWQMYLRDPGPVDGAPARLSPPERLAILAAAVATLWIGFFPGALLDLVRRAA